MTISPIHILVITPDPTLTPMCVNTVTSLQNGRTLNWESYTWEMLPLILNSTAPIVIADLRTPDGNDLELLSSLEAAFPSTSLLAFVDNSADPAAVLKMNVLDFLTPADLTPATLERVLRLAYREHITRAELQLVRSELMFSQSRLQGIFENIPIGISLVGLDGKTILHNPTIYRILGYPPAELDGIHYSTYLHPDDLPLALRNFQDVLRIGSSSIELRFVRKDGSLVWCNVKASILYDADQKPMYMIGTLQDITAHKLSDQLLLDSELKFRTLTETTAAAILIHNGARILYVNNAALELSGYTRDEIQHLNMWNLVHPEHLESARELWHRRKNALPAPTHYELKVVFKEDRVLWMDVTAGLIDFEGQRAVLLTGLDITARKQAEAALQDQLQLMQTLIDAIPHPIYYRDENGIFMGFNKPYIEGMGLTREQILHKSIFEIYYEPQIAQSNYEADQAVIRSGKIFEEYIETRRLVDMENRFIWRIKAPVMRADGECTGVVTILIDITDQKKIEAALRTSEQQYRLLADHASDLIYRKSVEGHWVYLSPSVENLLGYRAEDLLGQAAIEIVHPDDRPLAIAALQALIESPETTQSLLYRMRHQYGEYRWFEVLARAVTDEKTGMTTEVIAIGRDVTSRKEAEEALRESQTRFSTVFHSSPIAIAVTSFKDGEIFDCNESLQQTLGYSREELIGQRTIDLELWFDTAERDAMIARLRDDGAIHFQEHVLRHKSGTPVHVLASFEPIELNGIPSIITMFYDITERRKAEIELERRARQQAVIAGLGQRALEDRSLPELLALASDFVCEGLELHHALLLEWDRPGDQLIIRAQTGFPDRMIGEARPINSLSGHTLQAKRPVIVDDRRNDPHVPYGVDAQRYGLISSVAVVIPGGDYPFGVLSAHTTYPHKFTPEDVNFMQTVANLLATAIDRLLVERALLESRERFRIVSELSYDYSYCFRVEPDGRLFCEWITDAYTRLTGYPVDDMIGKSHSEPFTNIHPDDLAYVIEQGRALSQNRAIGPVEFRIYTKSGEVVWVQNYITPIWDEAENRMVKFIGSASDITQQKRRERELEAIVKVAAALRRAPNRASILGLALNEVVDLLHFEGAILATVAPNEEDLFVEATLRQWRNAKDYLLPLQNTFMGRVVLQSKLVVVNDVPNHLDRFLYPELFAGMHTVAAAPLIAEEKTFGVLMLGCRGTFPDEELHLLEVISEVIANALYRATVTETLANRVAQRTAELQEANARLQVLDQLKSKFVSDVSHELRTPVTNLGMHIYLLEHASPEKREYYIGALREQVVRLTNLVENILQISRLEMGKAKITFTPINLGNIARQVVEAHRPRAELKGIHLELTTSDNLPPFLGDYNQMSQVMTNLVANAVNYTSAGEVKVFLGADLDQPEVVIRVQDTGMGILPEDIPHLFERFYRGVLAGQSNLPGTGLGLSIVKEIVDLYDGKIDVESKVGKGTTFTIHLPILLIP